MEIGVIGTGYVGLVTGTAFADAGNQVTCVDIDKEKVRMLQEGKSPIYEPGLEDLLARGIREERLFFTDQIAEMMQKAQVVFIAVGTPTADDGSADLRYVEQAAHDIGLYLNDYKVIVNKSTVPVGTGQMVNDIIDKVLQERGAQVDYTVISNPEFLKEGSAIADFVNPDRVIIGTTEPKALAFMQELYAPFVNYEHPIVFMDRTSAELTKYAANGFLATKITYINEIANLAEKMGANVLDVQKGIGLDARIGKHFLFPGPGYGGSCFPKDVKAILHTAHENNMPLHILDAVEKANQKQKQVLGKKLKKLLRDLQGKTIAVWGLAFKARTDDMRESAAIDLVEFLIAEGALLQVFDPEAMENAQKIFAAYKEKIRYCSDAYVALENANALAIVTEWQEFRQPNFNKIKSLLKEPIICDARNLYSLATMQKEGFIYASIGRRDIGEL